MMAKRMTKKMMHDEKTKEKMPMKKKNPFVEEKMPMKKKKKGKS